MKMKKTQKYILLSLAALLSLAGCDRGDIAFGDFDDLSWREGANLKAFKVISVKETDLSQGLPEDCYVPEGEIQDPETKTTCTNVNNLVQSIFEFNQKSKVIEIAGTYKSWDLLTEKETTLSGKILLPKGRKPKRYIVVSHYTIGSNAECPSNCFPIEGVLCHLGYAMIFPDYEGYGVDSGRVHPYLMLQQTAMDVYNMYEAASRFLENTDYAPEEEKIYLMGFSQGGAVTMATQWYIESYMGIGELVGQVFAGGGPYDVRATYNNFIETDKVNIPAAVPLIVQGMIVGNNMSIKMEDLLQSWVYEKIDDWINSKKYTVLQLKEMMGTTKTSDILTEEGMDPTSDVVSELYKVMSENSILAFNWTPTAPVYMLHSMDDDVVPFVNASKAKVQWKDANIQYNFGHYGSHTSAAMRFIFSVRTWLKENEGK